MHLNNYDDGANAKKMDDAPPDTQQITQSQGTTNSDDTLFEKGCVSAAVHNHHQGLIDVNKDTKMTPPYALEQL
jgi:hypothetical protein